MSRTLLSLLLVSFLVASQATIDLTKAVKFAEKPTTAGWRQGGACWLRDGTLAVTLVMTPTQTQTNVALLSSFYNANFETTKTEKSKSLPETSVDGIKDASTVCLSSGGYAFMIQFNTAISVYVFDADGNYLDIKISKTAYGTGRSFISPTPDGGFLLSSVDQSGKNSIELYQADSTLRKTIDLSSTSSTTNTYVGLGVAGILVGFADGKNVILRRYSNDGAQVGTDRTFTEDWDVKYISAIQLANQNFVISTFGEDSTQLRIVKARVYDNSNGNIIKTVTVNGAEIDKYAMGALTGGDWVWGYVTKGADDGNMYDNANVQLYKNDGTAKKDAFELATGDARGGFILPRMDGTFNAIIYQQTTTYQQLFMARFDAETTQLAFDDACTTCPVLETSNYINATITFSTSLEDFKTGNGVAKLYAILVDILHVGADQITIIKLTSGSTIVDFQIKEDKTTSGSPTIAQIQTSLATAVSENKVTVLGASATGYTVKASQGLSTTSAGQIHIALFSLVLLFISMLI